jgi:hypothetical protein
MARKPARTQPSLFDFALESTADFGSFVERVDSPNPPALSQADRELARRAPPPPPKPAPKPEPLSETASGEKAKARDIVAAIRTLPRIEHRPATPEERDTLARFPGFGPVAMSIFRNHATDEF